jgi:2-keto-4-pentenoate hydratase/2-oxohepta-3-ene-1,7-dioic acid hydratase in catechol pathway
MMRLVRYDGGRTGLLVEDRVIDVQPALPQLPPGASWTPLIEAWPEVLPLLAARAKSGAADSVPVSSVTLEAPIPDPASRIFAMGGNFPMHTAKTVGKLEMKISDSVTHGSKDDTPPWGFYVIPGTIVGPEHDVTPPTGTQKLDYEAEVGVVLAHGARDGSGPEIWGYTAWNDFSIRDAAFGLSKVDHGPLTWSLQKNFTSGNACGPCMVIDNPIQAEGLRIICRINGETRQDGNTTDMKYSFEEIVAHIEEYLPLGPSDMILSGTPAGTGMEGGPDGPFLADGDVCEVEVTGTGILRNRVVFPANGGHRETPSPGSTADARLRAR